MFSDTSMNNSLYLLSKIIGLQTSMTSICIGLKLIWIIFLFIFHIFYRNLDDEGVKLINFKEILKEHLPFLTEFKLFLES